MSGICSNFVAMKIGIIAAMSKEIALLLPLIEDCRECDIEGQNAYIGRIGHHEVCVMECGIGKVNAALSADALIRTFRPQLIVNSGVAGGADLSMKICDVLIADGAAYHDVWCGPGTEYGAAHGFPAILPTATDIVNKAREVLKDKVKFGLICSGDKFITSEDEIADIKHHFPSALAVDMESAAIGQTSSRHDVPFVILRAISDTPGSGENISQYENFWTEAPKNTFNTLQTLLRSI